MRLLDVDADRVVSQTQLYLSETEARELMKSLAELLERPNELKHQHLFSEDGKCEISYSIVTEEKLNQGYSEREQRLLRKNR